MIDLHHIPARHDSINIRLEQWARWVRVRPQPWKMQSIWMNYRAPRQWEYSVSDIPSPVNTLEAAEIEKMVSQLPVKNREAIRWAYVYSYIHPGPIRRALGVTMPDLEVLINNGRDMLKNRLQQRLVNRE